VILVVGATGDLGGRVVRMLRQRGEPVRCLVRQGSDTARLTATGAEMVPGDLTRPASLDRACAGAQTVVLTATAITSLLAGAKGPSIRDVDHLGTAALIGAAEDVGVSHFVYLSYAGVDAGLGHPIERAKLAIEARLQDSPMRATIVRPDAFQEIHLTTIGRFDLRRGRVAVFGGGNAPRRWVSTADVAALVAAVATEPDPPALIEFGGPEPLTRNQAIVIAESLIGRRVRRRRVPRSVATIGIRALSRPSPVLASVMGLGLLQDMPSSGWDDGPLRHRGIRPRPASEFLRLQAESLRAL
jgi:uncharacterized protein YbjT (DUF2867 family)